MVRLVLRDPHMLQTVRSHVRGIPLLFFFFFFFNDTATTEIYTLSLHDALPIFPARAALPLRARGARPLPGGAPLPRSEEHTSELQSHVNLVCRLLLEKKKIPHRTRFRSRRALSWSCRQLLGNTHCGPLHYCPPY